MLSYIVLSSSVIVFIATKGVSYLKIKDGLKALKKEKKVSSFKTLTTSLAASLGIGNIVGVAQAIIIGGPGSVFWMWISAFFGSALKYAEGALGVKYNGPMNYIKKTNIWFLPIIFAFCGILASFGVGNMIQINSMANIIAVPKIVTGLIVAFLVFLVISKGTKGITNATSRIIPFITLIFILTSLIIILYNYRNVPNAFYLIFTDAFSAKAVIGGSIYNTIRIGLSRGIFSNEAGMGVSAIAHSMSKDEKPHNEGIVASFDTIIDTLFLCTLTALVILTTNTFSTNELTLCLLSFGSIGIIGELALLFSILVFGFATIIGWYYYGEQCFLYLFKKKEIYQLFYLICIIVGSCFTSKYIWQLSDVLNHLMTIPNILAILILLPTIVKLSRE